MFSKLLENHLENLQYIIVNIQWHNVSSTVINYKYMTLLCYMVYNKVIVYVVYGIVVLHSIWFM